MIIKRLFIKRLSIKKKLIIKKRKTHTFFHYSIFRSIPQFYNEDFFLKRERGTNNFKLIET